MRFISLMLLTSWLVACGGDAATSTTDETETSSTAEAGEDDTSISDGTEPSKEDLVELPGGTWEFVIEQEVEGVVTEREVMVESPATVDTSRSYPLVLSFHGNGGAARGMLNQLSPWAERGEFVAVAAQGLERSWNMGTEESKADDVAFSLMLVEHLSQYANLDMTRVYAMGFSNGSGIIHKMAVEASPFRAIAGFASPLLEGAEPTQSTGRVSVLQMHDVDDEVIPYEGGFSPATGHTFMSAEESAATWASHNDCGSEPESSMLNGEHTVLTYSGCAQGTEVIHIRTVGAGHGTPQDLEGGSVGVAWDFFQRQQ